MGPDPSELSVTSTTYDRVNEGQALKIEYLSDNPGVSRIPDQGDFDYPLESAVIFIVVGVGFMFAPAGYYVVYRKKRKKTAVTRHMGATFTERDPYEKGFAAVFDRLIAPKLDELETARLELDREHWRRLRIAIVGTTFVLIASLIFTVIFWDYIVFGVIGDDAITRVGFLTLITSVRLKIE